MLKRALEVARERREKALVELREWLAIPTISTAKENRIDMQRGAEWTADKLGAIGMENVHILPTAGHPLVYGEWLKAGDDAPTMLIYGHYDVQPAGELNKWQSPPFEPEIRDERLYGRGIADMKGQIMAAIEAVSAMKTAGGLGVNLKWLVEGEEEIGSEHLEAFIRENKNLLISDFCLNPDAGILAIDKPTISIGLRGLMYAELRVFGPEKELHSGSFGGVVHNPAQVIAELIAAMHNRQGKIMLPGFYDQVKKFTRREREDFRRIPIYAKDLIATAKIPACWGEPQYSPAERIGGRPTLEVNGLQSGFVEPGSKTIIPDMAMAKISCRLVPDQTPGIVFQQLRDFIRRQAPKTIKWELDPLHGVNPCRTERENIGISALAKAFKTVWNKKVIYHHEGGSMGVVSLLQHQCGIDSVLTGFSLPDCGAHSANENLYLPLWFKGIDVLIHMLHNLSSLRKG